ncbi:MAG: glucosamine-6-phosphate deaminase [Balneolaceae bacterium]
MEEFTVDKLKVQVYDTNQLMGEAAAETISKKINELLKEKDQINIVFASAPSQEKFLEAIKKKDVDWSRVIAMHMDEYVGLPADAPQLFSNFLRDRLFEELPFKEVHYMNANADDPEQECERYAALLEKYPTDICILGIGENTHIAFNDPHVADFNDPKVVKLADLDEQNRQQQVNDGMFETIDDVPTHAITLTVPALIKSTYTYTIVPKEQKAEAIYNTLKTDIQEKFPSTALRQHPNAILYLDKGSASKL